jgi:3-O-methylgallate 3,4-dioxygenase
VKRLFNNQPRPILPIFENTCYPPNQPTVKRSYKFGEEIRKAIESWDSNLTVAVVASGGMSHFVVDEEMDWMVLDALKNKDAEALQAIPRERLYSAASETQNWIALGGVLQDTDLNMEIVEYVPVYRTPAATGGGWGFARWQ